MLRTRYVPLTMYNKFESTGTRRYSYSNTYLVVTSRVVVFYVLTTTYYVGITTSKNERTTIYQQVDHGMTLQYVRYLLLRTITTEGSYSTVNVRT